MMITLSALDAGSLGRPAIRHGFFTRQGGVSDGVYGSLNCGFGSRDDPAKVEDVRLAEQLAGGEQADHCQHRDRRVCHDVNIGRPQIQIAVVFVAM